MIGALFGSLLNVFIVFLLVNLLLKKRSSLNVRALLTFLFAMIITFFLSKLEGSRFVIIDEFILYGISIVIAYLFFLSREKKEIKK
jgi:asparagine N-glycosylation enzyme membrane subunit Stt3